MAHDNQFREPTLIVRSDRFDFPKKGERYWDRYRHRTAVAEKDLEEKFLIIKEDTR